EKHMVFKFAPLNAIAFILLGMSAAMGDVTGINIQYRNLTIQIVTPEDNVDQEIRSLLMDEKGVLETFVPALITNAKSLGNRRIEATLEIEKKGNRFNGRVLANPPVNVPGTNRDGVFTFGSAGELVAKLCRMARFNSCRSNGSTDIT